MVHLLLSNGAKPYVTNNKGETPFDVASGNEIRVMLGGVPLEDKLLETEAKAPTFVPSYLAQPDLEKTWSLPGETPGLPSLEPPSKPYPKSMVGASEQSTELEVLVYSRGAGSETTTSLLGSIVANTGSSIENMLGTVNDEIDDVPTAFKLFKLSNDAEIPINKKQYSKLVSEVLRNATAIVLQEQ